MTLTKLILPLVFIVGCAHKEPAAPSHGGHGHKHHACPHKKKHHGHKHHACPHKKKKHGHKHGYKHHTAHHGFSDVKRWEKVFEDPARDSWQKPAAVLALMKLQPQMVVADLGSSTGYFTVRLARAVPRGKVWGVDIEPKMVAHLNARAKKEGLANLESTLGKLDDPAIPEPVDRVFVCNTYHHISARPAFFGKVAARMKPGARLVVVDFKMGKIPVGPPSAMRIQPKVLHTELTAAGLERVTLDTTTLPHQYVAIYGLKKGPAPGK